MREIYKACEECNQHSYLTTGGYYLCTFCGNKEYITIKKNKTYKQKKIK